MAEEERRAPSPPIVVFSAAFGLGLALVGLYLSYGTAQASIEISVAVATLMLCFGIGTSGALLSWLTGSRAALPNIGLSCGLVVLTLSFLSMCVIVGALGATILIAMRM
jgi:hypothetical protein